MLYCIVYVESERAVISNMRAQTFIYIEFFQIDNDGVAYEKTVNLFDLN